MKSLKGSRFVDVKQNIYKHFASKGCLLDKSIFKIAIYMLCHKTYLDPRIEAYYDGYSCYIPVLTFASGEKRIGIDPVLAWVNGQLVKIISVYGSEETRMFYGFCDICGAQPYGIEKCDEKIHKINSIQNEIGVLRKKAELLEEDCQKEVTRDDLDKEIDLLKNILKITIDAKNL
ncbi:Hypothetical predicted protein [Paramuricea clavata]|uniref:Uncharacterized protein n=1 Tax=Paramuricea clavata TaxID=317549 RepID=A0A6S7FF39_PARCT|nr:Hypothetical predicted protein [Paramuricea clavata]